MPPTTAATDAAARLLAVAGRSFTAGPPGATGNGNGVGPFGETASDAVATAERATASLTDTLARWFGPYGTHALLSRALARARPAHPVLSTVRIRGPLAPHLDGLAAAAAEHGTPAAAAGMAAVLADVVDLLARMIGEDMALHLVDRSMEHSAPNAPPSVTDPPAAPPPPSSPPPSPSDGGAA